MKLSIIIPFNRYIHYLYDCLESIKNQNLTDYEVLLVVDAIEDVKDKIHKYDLPITLIESGEATVGKKRNMGHYLFFTSLYHIFFERGTQASLDIRNNMSVFIILPYRLQEE